MPITDAIATSVTTNIKTTSTTAGGTNRDDRKENSELTVIAYTTSSALIPVSGNMSAVISKAGPYNRTAITIATSSGAVKLVITRSIG